jgi:hypothetical protein
MYDGPQFEDDHLNIGLRYHGMRKPSQILDALTPDLDFSVERAVEGGAEWMEAEFARVQCAAFLMLIKSNPDLDLVIEEGDEGDDYLDGDPEYLVIVNYVTDLIKTISDYTAPFTRYGWASDDTDDDGYNALGVWPDWEDINKAVTNGRLAEIDSFQQLTDDQDEIRKASIGYAIMVDGDDTIIFDVRDLSVVWQY